MKLTTKNEKKQRANKKLAKTPRGVLGVVLPPKPPRGVRIRNPKDCIKLINRLVNQVLTSDGDESKEVQNKLRVISYSLSVLLKAFEVGDLGERVAKLEERISCQSQVGSGS